MSKNLPHTLELLTAAGGSKTESLMMTLLKSIKKLHVALLLVLILSFFLNAYGIWWGLPTLGVGWAIDEILPSDVFRGARKYFSNGWHERYPPFHFYVLAVLYSPFLILHKLNIIDVHSLPTYTILFYIGRFLSVLMGTTTVFVVYLCGREIYDKRASVFAALITALIVPFIYHSKTTNLDIPYIFWFVLSLLFYIRILKNQKIADYLLFSVTAVISICTKDQAYGLYILPSVFIVLSHHLYKRKENKDAKITNSLVDRKIIFSLFLALTLFLVSHNVFFNTDGFIAHVKLVTGVKNCCQTYENSISGHLQMFYQCLRSLRFSFGWPIFLVCLLGLLSAFLQRKKNRLLFWILIPGFSYYLFLISVILYYFLRFYLPLCIILAFFGGKLLSDFLNPTQRFYKSKIVLVSAIFVYTLLYSFSVDVLMDKDSRYYVERWMKQNIDSKSLVVIVSTHVKKLPIRLERFKSQNIRLLTFKDLPNEWEILRLLERFKSQNINNIPLLDLPSAHDLARVKPDYIMTTSLDLDAICSPTYNLLKRRNTQECQFFSKLNDEKNGYKLILKYKFSPKWSLLNYSHINTHLESINPEIKIFEKVEERYFDR